MFISGIFTAFQQRIAEVEQWPDHLAGIAISCAVEFALFGVILKFLPDVHLRWKNVWHGALIAAILFSAGRFGLAIYFEYARIHSLWRGRIVGGGINLDLRTRLSAFSSAPNSQRSGARRYDPSHASFIESGELKPGS